MNKPRMTIVQAPLALRFHRSFNHKLEKEIFCICEWFADHTSKMNPSPVQKNIKRGFPNKDTKDPSERISKEKLHA
jgi:hypothetical protein